MWTAIGSPSEGGKSVDLSQVLLIFFLSVTRFVWLRRCSWWERPLAFESGAFSFEPQSFGKAFYEGQASSEDVFKVQARPATD